MKNNKKIKNLALDFDFAKELEVLCEMVQTNFATKAKELLFQWQIEELKNLEHNAPDLFAKYQQKIKKPTELQ